MDYTLFLSLCLIVLSSCSSQRTTSAPTIKSKSSPTPATILKTLTTTVQPVNKTTGSSSSVLFDIISSSTTTTPLPSIVTSPREQSNLTKINHNRKQLNNETKEILSGQEQAQSPFIGGRGRPNGFQPTLGPNVNPNYGPNYGVPFNSFLPQGLPFGGASPPGSPPPPPLSNGLNNFRPGAGGPGGNGYNGGYTQDQIGNNQGQGQLSSPLDLLSGFIPTPGPGGPPYTGTPIPFGQPAYPGLNPNYGPVNTPTGLANGLNNFNGGNNGFGARRVNPNGYNNQNPYGGLGLPETGLGVNPVGYNDGQQGGRGVAGQGVGGNDENQGVNDNGSNEETDDGSVGGGGGEDATGNNGSGETDDGGKDETSQPDYGGSGILSQQDLNDIQKSIEEQQKKEAEKKRQEESSTQPEYDYDNNSEGNGADEDQPATQSPATNVNGQQPNYNNQPINQPSIPTYQNRFNQPNQQGLNNINGGGGGGGAYAKNNQRPSQSYNSNNNQRKQVQQQQQQYGNNNNNVNNQRKSNRYNVPTINNQRNQFDDNIGYNGNTNYNNNDNNVNTNTGDNGRSQDYDYNGSGESDPNNNNNQNDQQETPPPRLRGEPVTAPRYKQYRNGVYSSSGESSDNDSGEQPGSRYGQTTPSYPRGTNFNRFNDESGRYRPGSFGRSGYRGEDLRDFGGHSANSDQQNDVEPGVDYSPDPIYDKRNSRKQDNQQHRSHNNHNHRQIIGQTNNNNQINNNNRNRFAGVKPSVNYDGETHNYQGSTVKPRLISSNQHNQQSTISKFNNNPSSSPSGHNHDPMISHHQRRLNQPQLTSSGYDSSEVDYTGDDDEQFNNQPNRSMNRNNLRHHNQEANSNLSQADYIDDQQDDSNNNRNYRQAPLLVDSEKKVSQNLSTINLIKKQNDPFLRRN